MIYNLIIYCVVVIISLIIYYVVITKPNIEISDKKVLSQINTSLNNNPHWQNMLNEENVINNLFDHLKNENDSELRDLIKSYSKSVVIDSNEGNVNVISSLPMFSVIPYGVDPKLDYKLKNLSKPEGFVLCDGERYQITNINDDSDTRTYTVPDMRKTFPMGYNIGEKSSSKEGIHPVSMNRLTIGSQYTGPDLKNEYSGWTNLESYTLTIPPHYHPIRALLQGGGIKNGNESVRFDTYSTYEPIDSGHLYILRGIYDYYENNKKNLLDAMSDSIYQNVKY